MQYSKKRRKCMNLKYKFQKHAYNYFLLIKQNIRPLQGSSQKREGKGLRVTITVPSLKNGVFFLSTFEHNLAHFH